MRSSPNMPYTAILVITYLFLSSFIDFFVAIAVYGHRTSLIEFAAATSSFVGKFIPALDNVSTFLARKGLEGWTIEFRALISSNWILFSSFWIGTVLTAPGEIRKKEQQLQNLLASPPAIHQTGVFSDLATWVFRDTRRTAMLLGLLFGGGVVLLYLGYPFTSSLDLFYPKAYLIFVYWGLWIAVTCAWLYLLILFWTWIWKPSEKLQEPDQGPETEIR